MNEWWVCPKLAASEEGHFFRGLDQVFSLQGEVLSEGKLNRMSRVKVAGRSYYVKLYFQGGKRLRRWLGKSRLHSERKNLLYFRQWQLPCPEVLAYGVQKTGPFFIKGAIVTEEIPDSMDLVQWTQNNVSQFDDQQWLDCISKQLAAITRCLHQKNFAHGDLKWRNILVTTKEKPEIFLIDCPGGDFWYWPFLQYRIVKDLACLDKEARKVLSKTQRLRFFLDYCKQKKLTPKTKKQLSKVLSFFAGRE